MITWSEFTPTWYASWKISMIWKKIWLLPTLLERLNMQNTNWFTTVLNLWKVKKKKFKNKRHCWNKMPWNLLIMCLWVWASTLKNQDSESKSQFYTSLWAKGYRVKVILKQILGYTGQIFKISQESLQRHLYIAMPIVRLSLPKL